VNKFRDYSGANAYRSTYVGGNCTTYCHSNGNPGTSGDQKTVSWTAGAAITDCKGCHGSQTTGANGYFVGQFGEPNYNNFSSATRDSFNAHSTKHVKAITDCYTCHNTTVLATGALAVAGTHINNSRNVSFNTAVAGASASYSQLTQRCSNVTCHSNTVVRWGQTVTCNSCHPLASLSGAHKRHTGYYISNRAISVYSNLTANKSTGADTDGSGGTQWASYGFGCSVCHPVNNANHGNGTVVLTLNNEAGGGTIKTKTTTAGYTGTIGTGNLRCQNVYCHSNGKSVFGNTSTWRYAYKPADRCGMCHGNGPNGTSHDSHVASLHNDDIYRGYSSGKMPAAGAVGVRAGHGDPAQSTTISCYLCHNGTTTVARNKYNSACSNAACHGNATGQNADATGATYITSLASHVNGSVEVQFANVVVKSKAQVRDASFIRYTGGVNGWKRNGTYKTGTLAYDYAKNSLTSGTFNSGTGSCNNVACHPAAAVNWTTDYGKAANCVICHDGL
jgi:predicted CxxxxCH...CXXCH cytochrome family protein